MFKNELRQKLYNIFGITRISFDAPADTREQEVLFVKIDNVKSYINNDKIIGRATGQLSIFINQNKMPYGFFIKKINKADIKDKQNLFFFNFDQNENYEGATGLTERKIDFVYFYELPYNTDEGEIKELNFN